MRVEFPVLYCNMASERRVLFKKHASVSHAGVTEICAACLLLHLTHTLGITSDTHCQQMLSAKRQRGRPRRLRVHTAAYLKVATKLQVGQPTTKLLSGFVLPSHTSSMQWDIHISHTRTWAFTLKWVGDLEETTCSLLNEAGENRYIDLV